MSTVTALRSRHLLGIEELDPDEIGLILDTATAMKEVGTRAIKKVPTLRGRCSSSRARARACRSSLPRSASAPTRSA